MAISRPRAVASRLVAALLDARWLPSTLLTHRSPVSRCECRLVSFWGTSLLDVFPEVRGAKRISTAVVVGRRNTRAAVFSSVQRGAGRFCGRLPIVPGEPTRVEAGLGATAYPPSGPETHEGWEDAAVPPDRLGDYLRDFRALLDRYDYGTSSLYGHFGQGCVHTRIPFDLRTADGIATYRRFAHNAAHLVVDYGGSLSGEHGDGQSRGELLPIMFGKRVVEAFEKTKALFNPNNHMNPGKVVHPYRLDANLRFGTGYLPIEPTTTFSYPDDGHRFSHAPARCVGVGKCRGHESGVMCPSYRATESRPG